MGINISYSNDMLIYEIKNTIRELIKNYSMWNNIDTCLKLEAIYRDKLTTLTTDQLFNVSLSMGYKYNSLSKDKICKFIIDHYKNRIKLLQYINKNIDFCSNMINQAKNGPNCKNVNKYIDDFFKCTMIPHALWISKEEYAELINNLKFNDKLKFLIGWIDDLEKHYNDSLSKLLSIIKMIKKDIDSTISQSEFEIIKINTQTIVKNMKTLCEIYYLLAINSK